MSAGASNGSALPRAIVLDAGDGGLVVARCLRRRGVPVSVLTTQSHAWAGSARGVDGHVLPPLCTEPDAWLERINAVGAGRPGVLIPASDHSCELLCRRRGEIDPALASFEGPESAHLRLMDKGSLYDIAQRAGIRIPRMDHLARHEQLEELCDRAVFPLVVKPAMSHLFRRLFGDRRVVLVHDAGELREAATPALDAGLELLAVEYVPGPETNLEGVVTVRTREGSLPLVYQRCKLRQHPPFFGAGSVLETIDSPEVLEVALRLLEASGFVGLSSLEAKRHAVTGELVLMEINVRIPQNIGLGEAAGVEPSWRMYATLAGLPLGAQREPRIGVKTVVPSLEIRALPAYVSSGDLRLRGVVRSYRGVRNLGGLSLADPRPLAGFTLHYAELAARALRSRGAAAR